MEPYVVEALDKLRKVGAAERKAVFYDTVGYQRERIIEAGNRVVSLSEFLACIEPLSDSVASPHTIRHSIWQNRPHIASYILFAIARGKTRLYRLPRHQQPYEARTVDLRSIWKHEDSNARIPFGSPDVIENNTAPEGFISDPELRESYVTAGQLIRGGDVRHSVTPCFQLATLMDAAGYAVANRSLKFNQWVASRLNSERCEAFIELYSRLIALHDYSRHFNLR